jgi:hypothetical protein
LASHTIDETAWVYNTVSRARSLRSDMEGVELNLWATSIPQVGNTDDSLKDTMKYYMYVKKINRLISLQSCSLGYHPSEEGDPHGHGFSCPSTPAEKDKEDNVWKDIRGDTPDWIDLGPDVKDVYNIPIRDMTPGSIISWIQLRDQPDFHESKDSTIIHCFAGLGRTGAVLLLFALRDYYSTRQGALRVALQGEWLGRGSSGDFYDWLKKMLEDFIKLDDEDGTQAIKQKIRAFDVNRIIEEVFDIGRDRDQLQYGYLSYIFVTRINYIIWCLKTKYLPDDNFDYYLYQCNDFSIRQVRRGGHEFTKQIVFSNPILVNSSLVDAHEEGTRRQYGMRFEPIPAGEFDSRPMQAVGGIF